MTNIISVTVEESKRKNEGMEVNGKKGGCGKVNRRWDKPRRIRLGLGNTKTGKTFFDPDETKYGSPAS